MARAVPAPCGDQPESNARRLSRCESARLDADIVEEWLTGPNAHRDGATQAIAASAWDSGETGLRWWSALGGDWHGVVPFTHRAEADLRYGGPRVLSARTPALYAAAAPLGMPMAVSVATLPDRESRD